MLQFGFGFSAQYIFPNYDFYKTFGWELGIGFVGWFDMCQQLFLKLILLH